MITNMIGKGKTAAPGMTEEKQRIPIEQQLMEYARSIREEGLRGKQRKPMQQGYMRRHGPGRS